LAVSQVGSDRDSRKASKPVVLNEEGEVAVVMAGKVQREGDRECCGKTEAG
jgi:hypothetical protein